VGPEPRTCDIYVLYGIIAEIIVFATFMRRVCYLRNPRSAAYMDYEHDAQVKGVLAANNRRIWDMNRKLH
jgi:hypothetical protein